jgi:hypothetical protein
MGYTGGTLSAGVITAANVNTVTKEIERVVNGGIESSDLKSSAWVDSTHIRPPRFFGAPAPRVEFASGDVHYREGFGQDKAFISYHRSSEADAEDWRPIEGLATTVHVSPSIPTQDVTCNIFASFFAQELDGNDATVGTAITQEKFQLCDFALFIVRGDTDPSYIQGTKRWLYRKHSGCRIGTKNHNIITQVDLVEGVNHIYVALRMSSTQANRGRAHVGRRSLVVDVRYL